MDERYSVYFFTWQCVACQVSPLRVRIGVSSNGELVAHWQCPKCQNQILATLPLEDVVCQIPSPPKKLLEARKEELTTADENLLRKAHILWPKD